MNLFDELAQLSGTNIVVADVGGDDIGGELNEFALVLILSVHETSFT